ncbi:MAG: VOC family protein [Candidatus Marinimicrobia bacterium]|nr:VOC family protein [Candidatus Neomarinimicrobiota bacterium]MCF7827871.1 VOC family protein [Candidatus Neomarinimicrobiota bacterium]MCF7879374.1 VOC family protein [Candidatus Neomarinimicrobiota bacterium]
MSADAKNNPGDGFRIPPETHIGTVYLAVNDLAGMTEFYTETFGMVKLVESEGEIILGTGSGTSIVALTGDPKAPNRPRRTTGLFHMAIVLPTRADLASMLLRMQEKNAMPRGAADHLVSEALYLSDPEGNGIEIYCDRPKEEWEYSDDQVKMATEPLDVEDLMSSTDSRIPLEQIPDDTRMGHMHLNVSDIEETEHFYTDILGFDVMARYGSEATFMSAGGYHHHIGANVWNGRGAPSPPDGARGLQWFELLLPDKSSMREITARLEQHGIPFYEEDGDILVRDPSENTIRFTFS